MSMGGAYRDWPNLLAMFARQAELLADRPVAWVRGREGWTPWAWREVDRLTRGLAHSLVELGVKPGDRVLLVSENRPEWWASDLAIMAAGGITVPAYTTNTPADHHHLLTDSGAVAAIASTKALAERVLNAAAQGGTALRHLVTLDAPPQGLLNAVTRHDWRELAEAPVNGTDRLDAAAKRLKRDDVACIIYTSGTGGTPKGVMLTHGGMLHNSAGAHDVLHEFGLEDEVFFSFLPLSHSYEHIAGAYFPMSIGAQVYFARGVETVMGDVGEVRPTIMTAVPRLYQAIRERILRDTAKKGRLARLLLDHTLRLGRKRYHQDGRLGPLDALVDWALDRIVRNRMRQRFGGRLKAFVSGGAPLNPEVGLFIHCLGLTVCQGYGQTEASPVISVNPPWKVKMHTAGRPLIDTEIKIAEDGEILVKGELVMKGYWNLPEQTAQTVVDGWLHTGDIGHLDEDGYLVITDRKKDLIVNAGGDNISPQRIEGLLALRPEIAQAVAFGDRRPYLVALINPDAEFVRTWARSHHKPTDLELLREDPDFVATLRAAVDEVNRELSVIEKVRRFDLLDAPPSIDNGELTPTLKIRRHIITQHYSGRIDALYRSAGS
ncbi:MAG: long-chain fatty acid--CoA ligase [Rhodospirillaceae bacterium]|nr:long-chain fatty acid--CoA ligase [Rhodospirillaceae bacterium]